MFKQTYCFIESFDSVRYAKLSDEKGDEWELLDTERKKREIQAEVELIYALLLGQKIIVPEAHSFDSVGFLEVITEALDARPKESLEKDWIREPFILSIRASYPTYLSMVSKHLKEPKFILSALSEINNNIAIRQELAKYILRGDFDNTIQLFKSELSRGNWDCCERKIDKIRKLNDYFSLLPVRKSNNLGERLEQYVSNLISSNNIPEALQQEPGFSKLQDGLVKLKKAGIQFFDRSTVRTRGREYLDMEEYLGIVEYIDGCYNAVIYQAIQADNGILTTTETTKGRYVSLAQLLSEESANLGPRDRIQEIFINRDAEEFKGQLETWHKKREDRWKSIWSIMLNDRWINSVNQLIKAISETPETKRDAYKAHIKELQLLTRDYTSDVSINEIQDGSQLNAVTDHREEIMTLKRFLEESKEGSSFNELKNGADVEGSTPGSDL